MSKSIIHGKFADKLHHVPLRLHRNPQRSNAATLQRIASALAEIQAILCNRSRSAYAAAIPTFTGARGGPGGALICFLPAALRAWVDDPSTRESGLLPTYMSSIKV